MVIITSVIWHAGINGSSWCLKSVLSQFAAILYYAGPDMSTERETSPKVAVGLGKVSAGLPQLQF